MNMVVKRFIIDFSRASHVAANSFFLSQKFPFLLPERAVQPYIILGGTHNKGNHEVS